MFGLPTLLSLTFSGLSYGMILFLIASGLTVTLGLMRVINLAHCGFAMVGGYVAFGLIQATGFGLLAVLPLAVLATALIGLLLERTVYQWVYEAGEMGQILMTVGLAFIMISVVNFLFGSTLHVLPVPAALAGNLVVGEVTLPVFRIFLLLVSSLIALSMWVILRWTLIGARLRAAVDNPRMARCAGINVKALFSATFAVACALAALGGTLGTVMMPLEPYYAVKYLVLTLIVVSVGGLGSLGGSLLASLLIGVITSFGDYYLHAFSAFSIYVATLLLLLARPSGLFGRA